MFWFSSTITIKWPAIVGVYTIVRYPFLKTARDEIELPENSATKIPLFVFEIKSSSNSLRTTWFAGSEKLNDLLWMVTKPSRLI